MRRLRLLTRRYWFEVLIAIGALESTLEVALRHDPAREPRTTLWFAAPAIAFVVLPLLGRRRFLFAAPAAVWLVAAALSFVDGRLVPFTAGAFLAGLAAAFLLGTLRDVTQGRIGLAITLSGAAIVAYNDPSHTTGDPIFTPCCSRSAGSPGSPCASGPRRPRRQRNAAPRWPASCGASGRRPSRVPCAPRLPTRSATRRSRSPTGLKTPSGSLTPKVAPWRSATAPGPRSSSTAAGSAPSSIARL